MDKCQDKKYWLGFSRIKGLGAIKINHLRKNFPNLQVAWEANFDDLQKTGLRRIDINNILCQKQKINLDELEKQLNNLNISYITLGDKDYPILLKEIFSPPPVLYIKGEIPENNHLSLAVVGTRKTSMYGRQITPQLIKPIVRQKIIIVSGLAMGIDTIAHQSCLETNGQTIAVLGCGLDRIYPRSNIKLAEKIINNNGCLISEYPPGTEPFKQHFPARNRIIAGLCRATLVVEGNEKSGSMITAKFALEYNRDVMAVPGNIINNTAQGTNKLIKNGAFLVSGYHDILEQFHLDDTKKNLEPINEDLLTNDEKFILDILAIETLHIDEIIQACKLNTSIINATLVLLEMKGLVKNLGDDKYVRT